MPRTPVPVANWISSYSHAKLAAMRPIDDEGVTLDAEYTTATDGDHLAIVLESMSGRAAGRTGRNMDYRAALELLLTRLKNLGAVVETAVVDSLTTQRLQLAEADRALLAAPVRLTGVADIAALRRRLTTAQTTIGQAPDARLAGNSTKRIRLGFGGALIAHRSREQVASRETRRFVLVRGLTTVLAGVAMFALLPLPPSSDPSLRFLTVEETAERFSRTTITCDASPCDMSWGGVLLLNYSVGSDGERHIAEGWASKKVARLAMRTAPGAPLHFVPLMDLGDGQHVFCFTGTNFYYGQFLAYDADGRLIENPPRDLWK